MTLLQQKDYRKVDKIFKSVAHGIPLIYSVIDGNSRGKIYVDSDKNPQNAFIFPNGGFMFLGSLDYNEAFLVQVCSYIFNELIPGMTEKEMILFSFDERTENGLGRVLCDKKAIRIQRNIFDLNERTYKEIRKKVSLLNGCSIKRMDTGDFEAYIKNKKLGMVPSKMVGCKVLRDKETVSVCVSIFLGNGQAEIDINTHENYRGKGFATVCACEFIDICLKLGLLPVWTCWPYRVESTALARKLGFDERKSVDAHFWAENM